MVPITDDTFKYISLNENDCILTRTLLQFVTTTRVQNNDIPALVQAMAWQWTGDTSPSEPKMPMNDWRVYASLCRDELMTYAHKYVATMVHRNID